jgi:hypothetical protein
MESFFAALERFYERVDKEVKRLGELNPSRFHCRQGCHECCVDGLALFEIEAENIRRHNRELLRQGEPRTEGRCAFLDGTGACRIYENRPYVCRTQGLPLRWVEELPDGGAVEMRDVCPLNEPLEPLENLASEECWSVGPFEEELAGLQIVAMGRTLSRIRLRDLFLRVPDD